MNALTDIDRPVWLGDSAYQGEGRPEEPEA